MDGFDATTWQALGLVLTVVGLLLSVLAWRRRGPAAGLRGVAWSLLPAAAGLTGTLRLVWDIGTSVVEWAGRLVFSPVVWSGIALAGISLCLFAVTAAMRARGMGRRDRAGRELPRQRSSTPARQAPASGRSSESGDSGDVEGMDDIEAILRKHGIS